MISTFEELQTLPSRPVPLLQRNQTTKEYIVTFTVLVAFIDDTVNFVGFLAGSIQQCVGSVSCFQTQEIFYNFKPLWFAFYLLLAGAIYTVLNEDGY